MVFYCGQEFLKMDRDLFPKDLPVRDKKLPWNVEKSFLIVDGSFCWIGGNEK